MHTESIITFFFVEKRIKNTQLQLYTIVLIYFRIFFHLNDEVEATFQHIQGCTSVE